jgi:hypothetical protein
VRRYPVIKVRRALLGELLSVLLAPTTTGGASAGEFASATAIGGGEAGLHHFGPCSHELASNSSSTVRCRPPQERSTCLPPGEDGEVVMVWSERGGPSLWLDPTSP